MLSVIVFTAGQADFIYYYTGNGLEQDAIHENASPRHLFRSSSENMESPGLPAMSNNEATTSYRPPTGKSAFVTRFGLAMKRHPARIAFIQWSMVGIYAFLLFAPLLFPALENAVFFWENLQLFSVFVFWGIGWPLIMLSTMIFGRIWCGIFCPEGTVTETISRYGRKRSIPRWIRWSGWPCFTMVVYAFLLFLSGATHHHRASVVLLGSLTFFAVLTGFLYANGKRVWCMYLCPSNAIFTFLAKLSPFHFRVDPAKWDAYQGPSERINCAPLINIKQMQGTSSCHACGRCAGYRDAVELATRKAGHEIVDAPPKPVSSLQAFTLLFGIIGMGIATLLLSRNSMGNLSQTSLPALFFLLIACALILGSALWALIRLASRVVSVSWQQLSLGLIPLAGIGLFLGFSALAMDFMVPANWVRNTILILQFVVLVCAFLFSLRLGHQLIFRKKTLRHTIAMAIYAAASLLPSILLSMVIWT